MAGGAVSLGKDCETCEKLSDRKSFQAGSRVRFRPDCKNCEVFKAQPIEENENILELYDALPRVYDPMSGLPVVTASDVEVIFKLYEVPEELRFDYFKKLLFYHGELVSAIRVAQDRETKKKEQQEKAKEFLKGVRRNIKR